MKKTVSKLPVKKKSSKTASSVEFSMRSAIVVAASPAVDHGVRWCKNILVEILGNYGTYFPRTREILRRVISDLEKVREALHEDLKG